MSTALPLDVGSMSDHKLLQQEKEMYENWLRYKTKSVCGSTFGVIAAIGSAGLSLFVSGPIVANHAYWASYYGEESTRCTEEVQRRGLTSLETEYCRLAIGVATTATIGAACAAIPFADGFQEVVIVAADYALAPTEQCIAMAAEGAVNYVNAVAESAHSSIESGAEGLQQIAGEGTTINAQAFHVHVDYAASQAIEAIARTANEITVNAPEILQVSIATATQHAAFIGCESLVGVHYTKEAKQELAKYLVKVEASKGGQLDAQTARALTEAIFAEQVQYVTRFRDVSNEALLQREADLVKTASSRLVVMGATGITAAIAVTPSLPIAVVVQARGSMLLRQELLECRIEINQRKLQSNYSQMTVKAVAGGLETAAQQLALPVAQWGASK